MKLKTTVKKIKEIAPDVRPKFHALAKRLNASFIERTNEVDAIIYGLLTRSHVMLYGPPGVSKSELANHVFASIGNSAVYRKLLMKGTKDEEIFGPLNIRLFKEKAVYEYNCDGMLPASNYAYLDELFRASDHQLNSMLGILNERTFVNGTRVVNCPLHTAIATTNSMPKEEMFEALHDRWLIRCRVLPVESHKGRLSMLAGYMEGRNLPGPLLSHAEVLQAHTEVLQVDIPAEVAESLLQIRSFLVSSVNITDRRLCQLLRLVQASAWLADRQVATEQDLFAVRFGLIVLREMEQENAFGTAYQQIVQSGTSRKEDEKKWEPLSSATSKLQGMYDEGMDPARANRVLSKVEEFRSLLDNTTFSTDEYNNRMVDLKDRMQQLASDLSEIVSRTASV